MLMPQRSGIDSHLQLIPERNRRSMPFNLSIGHEPNVTGAGPAILQGNLCSAHVGEASPPRAS